MPEILELLIAARADLRDATEEMRRMSADAAKNAASASGQMSADYTAAFEKIRNRAAIAFAALAASLAYASKEAMAAERSLTAVKSMTEISGTAWAGYGEQVSKTTQALQRHSRFSHEETETALAKMIAMTGDAERALSKMGLVVDVATALQLDLGTAAMYVARGMEGVIGRLGMLLPGLNAEIAALGDNSTAAERAAVIMARLGTVSGAAARDAATVATQITIAKNQFKDAADTLGNLFLPAISAAAIGAKNLAINLEEAIKDYGLLVAATTTAALSASGLVVVLTGLALIGPKIKAGLVLGERAALALGSVLARLSGTLLGNMGYFTSANYVWTSSAGALGLVTSAAAGVLGSLGLLATALIACDTQYRKVNLDVLLFTTLNGQSADKTRTVISAFVGEAAELDELINGWKDLSGVHHNTRIEAANAAAEEIRIGEAAGEAYKAEWEIKQQALKEAKEAQENYIKSIRDAATTTAQYATQERVLTEMLKSSDAAVRGYALDRLTTIRQELVDLTAKSLGIKPEAELPGRAKPPGGLLTAHGAEKALAKDRADWEKTLLDQGVSQWAAHEIAKTSFSAAEALKRGVIWENAFENHRRAMAGFEAGYLTFTRSITDLDMKGSDRWKAIRKSMMDAWVGDLAEQLRQHLFVRTAEATADKTAKGVAITSSTAAATVEKGNAITVMWGWLKAAYAKELAFYAWAGPMAPALAFATIIAGLAFVGKILSLAMKHEGGWIGSPGGKNDRLFVGQEGEFVVQQRIAQRHPAFLDRFNRGEYEELNMAGAGRGAGQQIAVGGDTFTIQITVQASGPMAAQDEMTLRLQLRNVFGEMIDDAVRRRTTRLDAALRRG